MKRRSFFATVAGLLALPFVGLKSNADDARESLWEKTHCIVIDSDETRWIAEDGTVLWRGKGNAKIRYARLYVEALYNLPLETLS